MSAAERGAVMGERDPRAGLAAAGVLGAAALAVAALARR